MQRVRIEFVTAGKVVKTFEREAADALSARTLAEQIAKDSGIQHDSKNITVERRCRILLKDGSGKDVELLETKAIDEADARRIAGLWSEIAGKPFATATVVWR